MWKQGDIQSRKEETQTDVSGWDRGFAFLFHLGWSWSLSPIQCHEPPSIVHQALCLSDLAPWIYFSLPLYSYKGLILNTILISIDRSSRQKINKETLAWVTFTHHREKETQKWIKYLNIWPKTIKPLQENICNAVFDIGMNIFLGYFSSGKGNKGKNK